ncbi:virulence factor Mce family protein [Saccharomonospora marina XMU15]|uniref:Virulence factor Mce family protein n=1 Tax=Saccharomonospora marina XMU15 TaxID=882083 RepID=H5X8G0_9PSEU|nr:MCE family protein [Saccharomonospora marina]EHR50256.1 virulence factor Mce family protein [Saccharomonospora marina XMU15]
MIPRATDYSLRRSLSERDPRVLAVAGAAAVALLLLGVLNLDKLPLVGDGRSYRAAFTDASGLQEGEIVTIAGIKVGTVERIELVGARVVVSFEVEDVSLPEGTRASIEIKSLLGQHHLALLPEGRGELAEGSEIPLERTTTPLNIVPALQRAHRTVEELDTEQLAKAMRTISATLEDTAPHVRATLDGLSSLSGTVASRDAELKELLSRTRSVTGTIAGHNADISELIRSADQVVATLHDRRETIRGLIQGTTALAEQVRGLVRDNMDQLGPTLRKLNEVLDVLADNERNLSEALNQASTYARTFNNQAGSGPWFDGLAMLPRGGAACSYEHTPLSELLDPVLTELNKRINGVAKPCLPLGPAPDTSGGYGGGR